MPAQGRDRLTVARGPTSTSAARPSSGRAQLAGDGSSDRMQVRFTAQWLSPDGWVPLTGQATSPWLDAGSAEFTWQQAGWTFALSVPQTGEAYQLRAVAEMKLGSGQVADADDRQLHRRRLVEQPRVVRDHAVHAERLERADLRRVVHGPDVELPAGPVDRAGRAAGSRGSGAT